MAKGNKPPIDPVVHSDYEAEIACLACCTLNAAAQTIVTTQLTEDHFQTKENRVIFRAILDLTAAGIGCSRVLIWDRLKVAGAADTTVSFDYIASIGDLFPVVEEIEAYVSLVEEAYRKRKLGKLSLSLYNQSSDITVKSDKMIQDLRAGLASIERVGQSGNWLESYDAWRERQVQLLEDPDAFPQWHLQKLCDLTGPLPGYALCVVGGGTSVGKTAFMLAAFISQALCGHSVGYISYEIPRGQLFERAIRTVAGQDPLDLPGTKKQAIAEAIAESKAYVYDKPYPLSKLITFIDYLATVKRCKAVYIDYLGLIPVDDQAIYRLGLVAQIGYILKELKTACARNAIDIILGVQLNREMRKAGEKPTLAAFRDSGHIENSADLAILLSKPAEFNADNQKRYMVINPKYDGDRMIEEPILIEVAKSRLNGNLGNFTIRYSHVSKTYLV